MFQQDTGLSESMEIDHNSSANFDEVYFVVLNNACVNIALQQTETAILTSSCLADVFSSDAL